MKKRKTYTFDSWLNDEIIETMFGEPIVESLGLQYFHGKGQLEKEDWENIKKHQLWTFDKALDMAFCFKKEGFIEILDNVRGSTDGSTSLVDSKNEEFFCITLDIFSKIFDRVSSSKNCKARFE